MADRPETDTEHALRPRYEKALVASGLVDDVTDLVALAPRPCRYTENDFVCRQGTAADSLWVIVIGSVAVRDNGATLYVRDSNEVVGELALVGNGGRRLYDLVVNENLAELLEIDRARIDDHPQASVLWRNIARIIAAKLKSATVKTATMSRQLADDTHILRDYTNEYALGRRMLAGADRHTEYEVHRAIVWFSDVVDFSRHVVNLEPRRTADIVQQFFNAQSLPISAHGGHIDKFIGDGLMAFWVLADGEPAHEKCLEALRAAEESTKAVAQTHVGGEALHLRIGLHLGLVLSGDFGSTTRHQFTLIGPEVNKAARLEEIHARDVVEGETDIGPIRLSVEFRNELGKTMRQRYGRRTVAMAKNLGPLEFYS